MKTDPISVIVFLIGEMFLAVFVVTMGFLSTKNSHKKSH